MPTKQGGQHAALSFRRATRCAAAAAGSSPSHVIQRPTCVWGRKEGKGILHGCGQEWTTHGVWSSYDGTL